MLEKRCTQIRVTRFVRRDGGGSWSNLISRTDSHRQRRASSCILVHHGPSRLGLYRVSPILALRSTTRYENILSSPGYIRRSYFIISVRYRYLREHFFCAINDQLIRRIKWSIFGSVKLSKIIIDSHSVERVQNYLTKSPLLVIIHIMKYNKSVQYKYRY